MTDELKCPKCGDTLHDVGDTQDGAGFDGENQTQCWSCGTRVRYRREVTIRYEVLEHRPGKLPERPPVPRSFDVVPGEGYRAMQKRLKP